LGISRLSIVRLAQLALALPVVSACGDATGERPEELTDPGPRDASFDGALSFDGVDDYASVGTARAPLIMRDQSLMLWFRPEGAASGAAQDLQVLFTFRRSDWSGIALALDHDVPLAYNVFGPRDLARWPTAVAPGAWHHLAYVVRFGSSESELFLDGVSAPTPGTAPGTNRTPTQAFIGSLDGYADMFHGSLDELRVYDRAFTPEEIAAVAAGTTPDDAEPLVIYLPFDEAEGGRSYDRSGLGNHAELGDGVPELMPTRIRSEVP
jgi:hypothetical protein